MILLSALCVRRTLYQKAKIPSREKQQRYTARKILQDINCRVIISAGLQVMKKVKITLMKIAKHDDLIEKYENPIMHACDMKVGQVFIANGREKPAGFCDSAWDSVSPFVMTLSHGGGNFYDGWMKNPKSAMISCNDGFRPVSFLLETMEEEAD